MYFKGPSGSFGVRTAFGCFLVALTVAGLPGCAAHRAPGFPVLYLDLDGTALSSSGQVLDETVEAVRAYQRRGGRLGIATGRTLEQARGAIQQLNPDLPVVLYNGGTYVDPERLNSLRTFSFPAAAADSALTLIQSLAPSVEAVFFQGAGSSLALGDPVVADSISRAFEFTVTGHLAVIDAARSTDFLKIMLVVEPEDAERVQSELDRTAPASTRCVISSPRTIEILPRAVNKAAAISAALDSLGWKVGNVVAIGDSDNDVEMIRDARFGVAMTNGRAATKAAADLIIGNHDEPAIAKFIWAFLIGENATHDTR